MEEFGTCQSCGTWGVYGEDCETCGAELTDEAIQCDPYEYAAEQAAQDGDDAYDIERGL